MNPAQAVDADMADDQEPRIALCSLDLAGRHHWQRSRKNAWPIGKLLHGGLNFPGSFGFDGHRLIEEVRHRADQNFGGMRDIRYGGPALFHHFPRRL
jgi:hypothetical protein